MTEQTRPAPARPMTEAACPQCGHDADHTTPCPDGCPQCRTPITGDAQLDDLIRALAERELYSRGDLDDAFWQARRQERERVVEQITQRLEGQTGGMGPDWRFVYRILDEVGRDTEAGR